jgi:hypothetical protein
MAISGSVKGAKWSDPHPDIFELQEKAKSFSETVDKIKAGEANNKQTSLADLKRQNEAADAFETALSHASYLVMSSPNMPNLLRRRAETLQIEKFSKFHRGKRWRKRGRHGGNCDRKYSKKRRGGRPSVKKRTWKPAAGPSTPVCAAHDARIKNVVSCTPTRLTLLPGRKSQISVLPRRKKLAAMKSVIKDALFSDSVSDAMSVVTETASETGIEEINHIATTSGTQERVDPNQGPSAER